MKKYIFLLFLVKSLFLNAGEFSEHHGVARESIIRTEKGFQSLQDLSVGDTLSSVPNSSLILTQGELSQREAYLGPALAITFDDDETVIASKTQPFLVNAVGPKMSHVCDINNAACLSSESLAFREAQYLQIGESLPTQFGETRKITDIQELEGDYPLISFTIPSHHTFVLKNGVVLHNFKEDGYSHRRRRNDGLDHRRRGTNHPDLRRRTPHGGDDRRRSDDRRRQSESDQEEVEIAENQKKEIEDFRNRIAEQWEEIQKKKKQIKQKEDEFKKRKEKLEEKEKEREEKNNALMKKQREIFNERDRLLKEAQEEERVELEKNLKERHKKAEEEAENFRKKVLEDIAEKEMSSAAVYKNDWEEYANAKESGVYDWDPEGFEENLASIPKPVRDIFDFCFPAGTPIKTLEGQKNIEDMTIGDVVIANDDNNHICALGEVENVYERDVNTLITLKTEDGHDLSSSLNHPYFIVEEGSYKRADEIQLGEHVLSVDGRELLVTEIEKKEFDSPKKVYNLNVKEYHTYYAGNSSLLVHNCGGLLEGVGDNVMDTFVAVQEAISHPLDTAQAIGDAVGNIDEIALQMAEKVVEVYTDFPDYSASEKGKVIGDLAAEIGSFFIPGAGGAKAGSNLAKVLKNSNAAKAMKEAAEDARKAKKASKSGLGIKFLNEKELQKRLGTNREGFHKDIKKEIKNHFKDHKDFGKELRKKNINNPDIGVDKSGNIVLRHPKTKVDIKTDVKLDSFKVD